MGHPWVMLNMVTSIDGAAVVDGTSGGLVANASKPATTATTSPPATQPPRNPDAQMLVALRRQADALLVGRRTVELEGYRRPTAPRQGAEAPRPGPRLVIVSGNGKLNFDAATFAPSAGEADPLPLVFCTTQHAPRVREAADGRAEVVAIEANPAGRDVGPAAAPTAEPTGGPSAAPDTDGRFNISPVLRALDERGASVVLCEGGPMLNGHLFAARAIDEINLTVAPVAVTADAERILRAPPSPASLDAHVLGDEDRLAAFSLRQVVHDRDLLFLRYLLRTETPK